MSKTIVMASGVFDIIHPGHLYYLERAKAQGTKLVVVVACDAYVKANKKKPVFCEKDRLLLVKSLRMVDEAYLGHEVDRFAIVRQINPAIIALGYDQPEGKDELEQKLRKLGFGARVIRIDKFDGSMAASSRVVARVKQDN